MCVGDGISVKGVALSKDSRKFMLGLIVFILNFSVVASEKVTKTVPKWSLSPKYRESKLQDLNKIAQNITLIESTLNSQLHVLASIDTVHTIQILASLQALLTSFVIRFLAENIRIRLRLQAILVSVFVRWLDVTMRLKELSMLSADEISFNQISTELSNVASDSDIQITIFNILCIFSGCQAGCLIPCILRDISYFVGLSRIAAILLNVQWMNNLFHMLDPRIAPSTVRELEDAVPLEALEPESKKILTSETAAVETHITRPLTFEKTADMISLLIETALGLSASLKSIVSIFEGGASVGLVKLSVRIFLPLGFLCYLLVRWQVALQSATMREIVNNVRELDMTVQFLKNRVQQRVKFLWAKVQEAGGDVRGVSQVLLAWMSGTLEEPNTQSPPPTRKKKIKKKLVLNPEQNDLVR